MERIELFNDHLDDYGFGTQTSLSQQNNGKDWQ